MKVKASQLEVGQVVSFAATEDMEALSGQIFDIEEAGEEHRYLYLHVGVDGDMDYTEVPLNNDDMVEVLA